MRSLLVQINSAADGSKVDFRTISLGGAGAAPRRRRRHPGGERRRERTTPPPGSSTVGTAGFSTMPFTFKFKGSFFNLGTFFNRLDRFVEVKNQGVDVTGRLLLLNSISLRAGLAEGLPAHHAPR